uniref:RNA-binding protein 48 n=1 Tax=Rhipicephalus appendiculatus TaxID=34631 RepID=A0A131YM44_RHIAP
MTSHISDVKPRPHHARRDVCGSRPAYRQGRKATAVKVFTINQESCYLLISNVSAVGAGEDLKDACLEYGDIDDFHAVDGYDTEEFTETYLVKFARIQSARIAKKKLDERSFFGTVLHVCYAPEFETLDETRRKIIDRCKYVAFKTGQHFKPITSRGRKRRSEAVGSSFPPEKRAPNVPAPISYIWAGQEYSWTQSTSSLPVSSSPSWVNPLYNDQPLSFNDAPRQNATSSERSIAPKNEPSCSSSQLVTDTYERTISLIRDKVKGVAVPNTDVLLRKRKP